MQRIMLFVLCLLCASTALAVPTTMNFQGQLANGTVLVNGTKSITFRLFNAETGGTAFWTETQSLSVTNGLFNAMIGTNTPLPVSAFDGSTKWVEIAVEGTTMTGRRPLGSVSYSFRAAYADTAGVALVSVSGGEESLWETDGPNVWRQSGRVGVGVSNPTSVLEINSQTQDHTVNSIQYKAINPALKLNATASGNHQSAVQFLKNGQPRWSLLNDVTGNDSQTIGFKDLVSGTTPLVVQSNGNVSVGTAATEAPFTVHGQLQNPANAVVLRNTLPGGGAMTLSIGADGANIPANMYGIGDETNLRLAINRQSGNIGIGTTSPAYKLHVNGPSLAQTFFTSGEVLGNGSVYADLHNRGLTFQGSWGYDYGDEYILFNSSYNPASGSSAPEMAKITAYRSGEEYDLARGHLKLSVRSGTALSDILVVDPTGVTINGALNVTQTKCRAVEGTPYGTLYYNAVESGHAVFTTSGRARLVNGQAHIELDSKWLAGVTINDQYPLDVTSIVFYGPHFDWYAKPGKTGFDIVESVGTNVEFFWSVQARQKGFEDTYLNRAEDHSAK